MTLLRRLFGSRRDSAPAAAPETFDAPLAPDKSFFVIGDIHGSPGLLNDLLVRIEAASDSPSVVCVGDYIDRGDGSAEVLRWLMELNQTYGDDTFLCLMGNHEEMLLQFLDDPDRYAARWLRNGGLQTLASFGVQRTSAMHHSDVRDALHDAMGNALIDWLRALPLSWQSGNVVVVHAGADPSVPISAQASSVLRWGHPEFHSRLRTDGIWVVHGHTIVDQANAADGRIAVDTGAYATGRLTAAYVTPNGVSFLSTK